ncbi:MAG: DNA primase [Oscillospiraceae bacterium]|nr:DNA primase [Oscillospiraceae bacterium]
MAIPDSFLDDLVSRTDIVETVSRHVSLTKRSGANMFGLCPFHSEKTPSFSVNADKQIYYCFGCGKGGGAINFVMEIENVTFRDAVEILARRVGLDVPEKGGSDEVAGKRRRMLELNRDAAKYFHDALKSPAGSAARDYLTKRGISWKIVTKFGIGAAPDSWSALLDAMLKKGYSRLELVEAGLIRNNSKDGSAYDMFRGRVIFPIIDTKGEVVGFSGRILGDGEFKYLNSPDTLVFNKSRNLFGLNLAKKTKSGMLILVEGNIDVVAMHLRGFDCAVASLGTSLTAEQARLMSRYTKSAIIAYDADEAGRKAALRAIPILEKTGMDVRVADLGNSKDPDEYLKKHGADALRLLIENCGNHIDYRLKEIQNKTDLASDDGRLSYLAAATDLLAELENEPEREIYCDKVARIAGVSKESVQNETAKKLKSRRMKQRKAFESRAAHPRAAVQPLEKELRYENEYSAAAEEGIIRCIVRDSTLIKTTAEMGFSREEFTSPFLSKVYETLTQRISEGREVREALIVSELTTNEAASLSGILQKPESLLYSDKTIREYIEKIRTEKYKSDIPDNDLLLEIRKHKQRQYSH